MLTRSHAGYAIARPLRARSHGAQPLCPHTPPWSSGRGFLAVSCAGRRSYRAGDDGRNIGSILVRNGTSIKQEDLISAITPIRLWDDALNNTRDVVLLVSKGLSHWLNAGDNFLPNVLSKLLKNHIEIDISQVNVLLAVVDRLPNPSHTPTDGAIFTATAPCEDFGSEGLAYWVMGGQQLLLPDDTSATPAHNSIRDRNRPFDGPPGAIHFRFVEPMQGGAPTSLEVALANTIFSTATRRILRRSTWALPLRQTHSRDLDSVIVNLPSSRIRKLVASSPNQAYWPDTQYKAFGLNIPLIPLTARRTISDCMGNVIRRIKDAEEGASKELEDAVTQYFDDNGKDPMTAAVWAVITPAALVDDIAPTVQRYAISRDRRGQVAISEHALALRLWRGATLRRVISGGGGWGDKAGLLSLDHDTGVSPTSSKSNNNNMELDLDAPDFANLFTQKRLVDDIAKPGDSIQFFIAPEAKSIATLTSVVDNPAKSARLTSIDFGVIPIKTEAVAASDTTSVDGEGEKMVEAYSGHFGALSEVGLGLRREIAGIHNTKIDVPFSRFWYQGPDHTRRKANESHRGPMSSNDPQQGVRSNNSHAAKARGDFKRIVPQTSTTFTSTFNGRSLNEILGKRISQDPGGFGQSRKYSTRTPETGDRSRPTDLFHLPAHSYQAYDGLGPFSDGLQAMTNGRAKTASKQANRYMPISKVPEVEETATLSLRVQRTSARSVLDDKGGFRLAKSNPSPAPAARHILVRKGYEPGMKPLKSLAQPGDAPVAPHNERNAKQIQRNAVPHSRKYDPGVKIRRHGVSENDAWKASAARPSLVAGSDASQVPRPAYQVYGTSSTKHKTPRSFQKYNLRSEDAPNIANPFRRKRRHAEHLDMATSDANGAPSPIAVREKHGADNTEISTAPPSPIHAFRIYMAPESVKTPRDQRIETRKTFETLQGQSTESVSAIAPLEPEVQAPQRKRRISQSPTPLHRTLPDQTKKARRGTKIRKHIVDKSELFAPARLQAEREDHIAIVRRRQEYVRLMNQPDIVPDLPPFSTFGKDNFFADYDAPVRKTVPRSMPSHPSKLLSIPELMLRRARAKRKGQSGSTRMVRAMPSTRKVRRTLTKRLARRARLPRAKIFRSVRSGSARSVYEMAARGTTEDTKKLQEIKTWLNARIASSSAVSGGDNAFKIEDWSQQGQSSGRSLSFTPRSNRALDEIDDVFRDLYKP